MLHGIFKAASSGQMNINRRSWITAEGAESTPYPAQVSNNLLLIHPKKKKYGKSHVQIGTDLIKQLYSLAECSLLSGTSV